MLPSLSSSILSHHILPLSRLTKNSKSSLRTLWHPGYGENKFVCVPLLTWPTQVSNLFGVGRERKSTKNGLTLGLTIGGGAAKNCKNTHLFAVMRPRLSQKIGLLDLKNRTRFKKGNGYKIRTKIVRDNWGMRLMLHTRSIYYWHTTSWECEW